ncbi:M48 family metalloprotease [Streptomyces huasconensis]|uniref:M48 family metalloprotease n=1 Tax=Streptomyces huasconensis TaxID=1854574 RepID=UPI0033FE9525
MTSHRPLGAGTTLRFLLLLALIAISSLVWLRGITARNRFPDIKKDVLCQVATGSLSGSGSPEARSMYARCMGGAEAALRQTWQQTLLALLALAIVALVIYALLPTWKRRRRRLVPLDVPVNGHSADPLLAELAELRDRTGVSPRRLRFLLDPYDRSSSAVVFGRFGHNTIVLNAGLINRYATGLAKGRADAAASDLQALRGVVLHELNHVAHRDVGLTYATIAAWRSFALLVFVPSVVLAVTPMWESGVFSGAALASDIQFFGRNACLVAAVYLARADILRVREYHADVLPPQWQVDLRRLFSPGDGKTRPWHVRLRAAVRHRWHPSEASRYQALADPARLFRTDWVPIGIAGFVAALIADQSMPLAQLQIATSVQWLTAALMLAVAAAPIWRAAMYAADHDSASPRGWREGIALGTGLVAGYVITFRAPSAWWLPPDSWILLLLFAGCLAGGVWMAQLASLAARLLSARLRTPGFWASQLATTLAFGAPLVFLFYDGTVALSGGQPLGQMFSGVLSQGRWLPLPRPAAVLHDSSAYIASDTAAQAGAALVWLVPASMVIASLLRRRSPGLQTRHLFRLAGCGAACCLAVTAVTNRLWHGDLVQHDADDAAPWLHMAWQIGGLIAVSATVAVIATVLMPDPAVPYAVITAGASLVAGALGMAAMWLADGCLGAFNAQLDTCARRDIWFRAAGKAALYFLSHAIVLGMLGTIGAAVVALAARDLRCRLPRWRISSPDAAKVRTYSASPRAAVPLIVVAVALTAWMAPQAFTAADDADATIISQIPGNQASRTTAWLEAGGLDLMQALMEDRAYLIGRALYADRLPRLTNDTTAGQTVALYRAFEDVVSEGVSACRRLSRDAQRAERFIPIPDRSAHATWKTLYTDARKAGDRCARDLASGETTIYDAAASLPSERLDHRLTTRLERLGVL